MDESLTAKGLRYEVRQVPEESSSGPGTKSGAPWRQRKSLTYLAYLDFHQFSNTRTGVSLNDSELLSLVTFFSFLFHHPQTTVPTRMTVKLPRPVEIHGDQWQVTTFSRVLSHSTRAKQLEGGRVFDAL